MDQSTYNEIIQTLAKCGRPDLIQALHEFESELLDLSYVPAQEKFRKRESLSDEEGSAVSEEEYQVNVDSNGFHSLI